MILDYIKTNAILILGTIVLALSMALTVQTYRLRLAKAEHKTFVVQVEGAGKAAQAKADAEKKANDLSKKVADEKNKRDLDILRADNQRLRNARAGGSVLPPAAPAASRPDRITFDRAELESALRQLDAEVSELVGEGDEARVKLDTAKGWAKHEDTTGKGR